MIGQGQAQRRSPLARAAVSPREQHALLKLQRPVSPRPLAAESGGVAAVGREVEGRGRKWEQPGVLALLQLAWAAALAALRQGSPPAALAAALEEDEMFVELALEGRVFHTLPSLHTRSRMSAVASAVLLIDRGGVKSVNVYVATAFLLFLPRAPAAGCSAGTRTTRRRGNSPLHGQRLQQAS